PRVTPPTPHFSISFSFYFFFFNDPPTPALYTLSLHDALPISPLHARAAPGCPRRSRVRDLRQPPRGRLRRHRREGSRRGRLHRRSEEHTSELQSRSDLVCRLLLEKKKKKKK